MFVTDSFIHLEASKVIAVYHKGIDSTLEEINYSNNDTTSGTVNY